jgi:iron complex transport system permease protein
MGKKPWFILLICSIGLLVWTDLQIGSSELTGQEIWKLLFTENGNTGKNLIFWEYRFPRVFSAILAGIGLPLGGLLMQSYFRNPLAGPYVIGIGSGASFGVALFFMIHAVIGISFASVGMIGSAFLGAILVLAIISAFSYKLRSSISILLIGLMLSYLFSAIINFLQSVSDAEALKQYILWGLGSFSVVTKSQLPLFCLAILVGIFLSWRSRIILDAFYLPDFEAKALGISIKNSRYIIFITVALLVGSVTAFCGPIAFLGMAVPHISKLIFKEAYHKYRIPQTILVGIALSLVFDILSQNPFGETLIPLNTISSAMGAPLVIWLLWKNKHRSF